VAHKAKYREMNGDMFPRVLLTALMGTWWWVPRGILVKFLLSLFNHDTQLLYVFHAQGNTYVAQLQLNFPIFSVLNLQRKQ